MSGTWDFILCDSSASPLAELSTAAGRSIAFKRNSYAEVNLTLSHEDDAASLLLTALASTGVPKLKGYRRGPNDVAATLRFRGSLAALQEQSDEASIITATFRSPFGVLIGDGDRAGRFVQGSVTPGDGFPLVYSATDAGYISENLINIANLDAPTGLATDPGRITATKLRDRTYPPGQNIGSAVSDLTAVLDGFDFYETFVETGTATRTPLTGGPQNLTVTDAIGASWLAASSTYYWIVTAIVGGVESPVSNEVSRSMSRSGVNGALLQWAAVSGASSYNVYRATNSGGESISPALVVTGVTGGPLVTYADSGTAVLSGAPVQLFGPTWFPDAFLNIVASQGIVNSSARFEYGAKTLSNVQSLTRNTTPPTNCIFVTGGNGLTSTYIDTNSVAKYGRWWGRADFADIIDQSMLDDKAKALCRSNPIKTVTFIPELGLDSCPKPFDDWNLGDTVPLYASRSALTENTQLRINGFTLPIDENGLETVSVDDPTSPEEDAIVAANLEAEVVV